MLHYSPNRLAIDQIPPAAYTVTKTYAEHDVSSGTTSNFLPIFLARVETTYSLTQFAASFTTDFEAFLGTVDTDDSTP